MALPRYGSTKRAMPVLDHRAVADPWANRPAVDPFGDDLGHHEPTDAERARTVVANNRQGVLSVTIGVEPAPLGFVVPYATDDRGVPYFTLRPAMEQTVGPLAGRAACLAVAGTPLTASHASITGGVTLLGIVRNLEGAEADRGLVEYKRMQPADAASVKQGSATLYRLDPAGILIATSADVTPLTIDEYAAASSDPLAAVAPGLATHLTGEQGGVLVLLVRAFGGMPGASDAHLAGIDRHGMDLLVTTPNGRDTVRLTFGHPVATPEEVRRELVMLARAARFKLGVG